MPVLFPKKKEKRHGVGWARKRRNLRGVGRGMNKIKLNVINVRKFSGINKKKDRE